MIISSLLIIFYYYYFFLPYFIVFLSLVFTCLKLKNTKCSCCHSRKSHDWISVCCPVDVGKLLNNLVKTKVDTVD